MGLGLGHLHLGQPPSLVTYHLGSLGKVTQHSYLQENLVNKNNIPKFNLLNLVKNLRKGFGMIWLKPVIFDSTEFIIYQSLLVFPLSFSTAGYIQLVQKIEWDLN